ncbi:MAG: SMP-30/gluconolactonase/LRE family protein [Lachnospiraceae bacterium]|nr:SMP-30/gluconolactonase/LRE family protein [Lachnospiraceae bacterium]
MKTYEAKIFMKKNHRLAESPFYDERYKRLSWVDIIEGKLYTLDENEKLECVEFGQMIGAAVPLPDEDGYMVAATDGIYTVKGGVKEKVFDLTKVYEPGQRSNDAKMDSEGRLWFGSVVYDGKSTQHGDLFSYKDGEVVCRFKGTKLSNGMAWNKANDKFYFSDSDEKKVFVFDYDKTTGDITNRRTLFDIEKGVPDGMFIDEDDNLWVAIWNAYKLEKRDGVTGEKLAEVKVPAEEVSSCCFYGDKKRMFITTASESVSGEWDGCLYECYID